MNHWKRNREEIVDVAASVLLALPLYLLLLRIWPEQPTETLGFYLRQWAFFAPTLFCLGVVRAIRLWRGPQSERAAAFREGAIEVGLGIVYLAVVIAGAALLLSVDRWMLQSWPFWARLAVAVPLGFPAIFGFIMLGLWLGSIIRGKILPDHKPQMVTREIAPPDAIARAQLASPLTLRRNEKGLVWFSVPCFLMGIGAWTGYSSALANGKLDAAILIASFALWIELCGLFMLTQSGRLGRISATDLKPRFGQVFSWQQVVRLEQSRARNIFGLGETRVLQFVNADGKSLWNLTLSEIKDDDLEMLEQLIPALRAPFPD